MRILTIKQIQKTKKASYIALWGSCVFFLIIASKIFMLVKSLNTNKVSFTVWECFRFGLNPASIPISKQYNALEVMSILVVSKIIMWISITFMYLLLVFIIFAEIKQYEIFAQKISDLEKG